jgi:hypothetical protein
LVKPLTRQQSGLQRSLLCAFVQGEGLEKVLAFVEMEGTDSKGKPCKLCPLPLAQLFLAPTKILADLDPKYAKNHADLAVKALKFRLDNLTDSEVRELDKSILNRTIGTMGNYIQILNPDAVHREVETFELHLADRFLKSPFFEKRVKGINEFRDIIIRISQADRREKKEGQNPTRWLNYHRFAEWVSEHNVVEFIFLENPHAEFIKRTNELIRAMAMGDFLNADHITMIWNCARGDKHEDIVRTTYELVTELSLHLPLEFLE